MPPTKGASLPPPTERNLKALQQETSQNDLKALPKPTESKTAGFASSGYPRATAESFRPKTRVDPPSKQQPATSEGLPSSNQLKLSAPKERLKAWQLVAYPTELDKLPGDVYDDANILKIDTKARSAVDAALETGVAHGELLAVLQKANPATCPTSQSTSAAERRFFRSAISYAKRLIREKEWEGTSVAGAGSRGPGRRHEDLGALTPPSKQVSAKEGFTTVSEITRDFAVIGLVGSGVIEADYGNDGKVVLSTSIRSSEQAIEDEGWVMVS